MSFISARNFPDFVLRDTSTNCLQLLGFLSEQSMAKVRIISKQKGFYISFAHISFAKSIKSHQLAIR